MKGLKYNMFGFENKKDKKQQLLAVMNGRTVNVLSMPDEIFSKKIIGDGFAVDPFDGTVVSPADGKLADVQSTGHAYEIETYDGLNILVHIGINTVSMSGDGFKSFVEKGDRVKAGEKIAEVNLDMVREAGFPTYTIVLITNMNIIKSVKVNYTEVKAGETVALTYEKQED